MKFLIYSLIVIINNILPNTSNDAIWTLSSSQLDEQFLNNVITAKESETCDSLTYDEKAAICNYILNKIQYDKYGQRIYFNVSAFANKNNECYEKTLSFAHKTEFNSKNVRKKIFSCFARHDPMRTSLYLDDAAHYLTVCRGSSNNEYYIFRYNKDFIEKDDNYILTDSISNLNVPELVQPNLENQYLMYEIKSLEQLSRNPVIQQIEINYHRDNISDKNSICNLPIEAKIKLCQLIVSYHPDTQLNHEHIGSSSSEPPVMCVTKSIQFYYLVVNKIELHYSKIKMLKCPYTSNDKQLWYVANGYRDMSIIVCKGHIKYENLVQIYEFYENVHILKLYNSMLTTPEPKSLIQNNILWTPSSVGLDVQYIQNVIYSKIPETCHLLSLEMKTMICNYIFSQIQYDKYDQKIYFSRSAFANSKNECFTKTLQFAFKKEKVRKKLFFCFERHEPMRTSIYLDDAAHYLAVSRGVYDNDYYIFHYNKHFNKKEDHYILTDGAQFSNLQEQMQLDIYHEPSLNYEVTSLKHLSRNPSIKEIEINYYREKKQNKKNIICDLPVEVQFSLCQTIISHPETPLQDRELLHKESFINLAKCSIKFLEFFYLPEVKNFSPTVKIFECHSTPKSDTKFKSQIRPWYLLDGYRNMSVLVLMDHSKNDDYQGLVHFFEFYENVLLLEPNSVLKDVQQSIESNEITSIDQMQHLTEKTEPESSQRSNKYSVSENIQHSTELSEVTTVSQMPQSTESSEVKTMDQMQESTEKKEPESSKRLNKFFSGLSCFKS